MGAGEVLSHDEKFVDETMSFITNLGNREVIIPVMLMIPDKEAKYDAFKSVVLGMGIAQVIKMSVGKSRPFKQPIEYIGFNNDNEYQSFPSGHATASFALATSLSTHYPKYKTWFFTLAVLISASRIYEDRHWFTDVVAGAGIGYLSAKFVEYRWWYIVFGLGLIVIFSCTIASYTLGVRGDIFYLQLQ